MTTTLTLGDCYSCDERTAVLRPTIFGTGQNAGTYTTINLCEKCYDEHDANPLEFVGVLDPISAEDTDWEDVI